ncbi:Transposase [Nostoc flagelliforme CCNUN1]|uniref:Transposase n=2 Tax=Nostoc flagelliforme CCNUN1 TaxID=2038116 RepID=A0A2K8T1X9_9NOSO|nr:Transposase [Nostoc flagelliforme CCNUN1]AUB35020.1 Transposase [Nostoc flagelliforme CCNUN1]AUB35414.1 Transposase [Nostoc flagelliforme CCNUN1]AUB41623.1 Transposase [Nostoc flagelliforme CCNUN1]
MKNHIYSTFDLSKSLEHFQEKVTKLLELTNISEWDGHVFREREKKIREIALVLAERNYILKAYRRRLLKYNEVASRKLPLGSGAVESLIRQVVNLRMKGNSKFWLQNNAEIMLHLRCQWIAKSWDNFCDSIFNSFIKPQTA